MPQKPTYTPMMEQYMAIKENYLDAFLFYRLGDFYELFYDDAIQVSQLLELTLTSRNKKAKDPIPMCGVPHKAAGEHIEKLVELGYKVAICEQMEDPKKTSEMVKREVVQVVTPGMRMDDSFLHAKVNNYLVALAKDEKGYGLSYADLSTGEVQVTRLTDAQEVLSELSSLQTKEILFTQEQQTLFSATFLEEIKERLNVMFSNQFTSQDTSEIHFLIQDLTDPLEKEVVQKLLTYIMKTQKRSLAHLQKAKKYEKKHYLSFDYYSKYNLELVQSIRTTQKKGTLLWLLDETKTAMGGRLLKKWLDRPLIQFKEIETRQNIVSLFLRHFFERNDLIERLKKVYDLERLSGRIAFGNINGRDLLQLRSSLEEIPAIITYLEKIDDGSLAVLKQDMNPLTELTQLIQQAIQEEAPLTLKEGNLIKEGFNEKLDDYHHAMHHGKQWLKELEQKEKTRTGVKTLKVSYHRIYGYYIEVTKTNISQMHIPKDYQRIQTLANSERFTTEELQNLQETILSAQEKALDLEYLIFQQVREEVKKYIHPLQQLAKSIATLDCLLSFAYLAEEYHYVKPQLEPFGKTIRIEKGRHPVVEKVMGIKRYVPNDITMDEKTTMLLITGPNMSGKSTYMRQVALTIIMAQMGCFVPAESCLLPIFDKIFTRIGASDDLISGQSTFMVEMMEANQALCHATARSLILFDELGRGTATYDGMALAQSIIEFVHENIQAKTLFSTHYHELTVLDQTLSSLKNVHVGAVEKKGEVVFLHQMMDGPADKSYGVHVAKIAGLPKEVLQRAEQLLIHLEDKKDYAKQQVQKKENTEIESNQNEKIERLKAQLQKSEQQNRLLQEKVTQLNQKETNEESNEQSNEQLSLFSTLSKEEKEVLNELQQLDLLNTTALQALISIGNWQGKLKEQRR